MRRSSSADSGPAAIFSGFSVLGLVSLTAICTSLRGPARAGRAPAPPSRSVPPASAGRSAHSSEPRESEPQERKREGDQGRPPLMNALLLRGFRSCRRRGGDGQLVDDHLQRGAEFLHRGFDLLPTL